MPVLRNARHERFAQLLAQGSTATAAYEAAGYKPHDGNAARLSGNERIKARVAELQGEAARVTIKTIEDIVADLETARTGAIAEKSFSAAVQATMGQAKVLGLVVDRHAVSIKRIEDMTEDEIDIALGIADGRRDAARPN